MIFRMCGIFGFINSKNSTADEIEAKIESLFLSTEPRGRQAAGIALLNGKQIRVYKRPLAASQMLQHQDYKKFLNEALDSLVPPIAVLGHCRLVTDGSEILSYHNQPMIEDHLVGVHNGVVNNFSKLRDENQLPSKGASDSEVLFQILNKNLNDSNAPEIAMADLYSSMRGSASLGLLFKDYSQMSISTDFGSLYYALEENEFVFGSEDKIVDSYFDHSQKTVQIHKLFPGRAMSVDLYSLKPLHYSVESQSKISVQNRQSQSDSFKISLKHPDPKKLKRCTRCILPINYPFIEFDQDGVCSMCRKYERQNYLGKEALHRLFDKYRSKNGEPDCLIGLSGGRDSSYGLHLLKTEFGMNPIGFCYDWLMTSRKARHNIAKMAGALGVEVIYRCGDYETQAKNIRKNIYGFLKQPDLGMMTFVQAGDKEMYHYGRKIRKEKKLDLTIWCSGFQLEQREFFIGYCGINKTLVNNPRLYDYGWITKLRLATYYGMKTLMNPAYWNRSVWDNFMAFWHCFVAKDNFLYLFNYYPWDESEIERVLREDYDWEADMDYGDNQWRMDDFHTAFTNYVYYTVGGFSEFDDFRSNQIREGLLSRDEALRLATKDNQVRYESLREFSNLVGFNLEHVLKKVDSIPKLYTH